MRRKIFIAATIIFLLLLSFTGFLEYRQHSSYKIPIHAGVRSIIKVNADAFIKSFLKEYGFNFRDKISRQGKKEKASPAPSGIFLPGNIFIYTLGSRSPSTLFCTIPLSNPADFKLFAGNTLGLAITTTGDRYMGKGYNDQLTVLVNSEYAAIAYSTAKEEVLDILQDLLDRKNLLQPADTLIGKLKQYRSHVVYADKNGIATAAFSGNRIRLEGEYRLPAEFSIPSSCRRIALDSNRYASLCVNIKIPPGLFSKTYNIKRYQLESDSLLSPFNGFIAIDIPGLTWQQDTITTYRYNDNFEKTVEQTISSVQVPVINMNIEARPSFLNYLQRQEFITGSHQLNREVFPLYQVSVNQAGQELYFSTGSGSFNRPKLEYSSNCIELSVNFKKLQPLLDSVSAGKFTRGITGLTLYGRKNDRQLISFEGGIDFDSPALKKVAEMIRSW